MATTVTSGSVLAWKRGMSMAERKMLLRQTKEAVKEVEQGRNIKPEMRKALRKFVESVDFIQ